MSFSTKKSSSFVSRILGKKAHGNAEANRDDVLNILKNTNLEQFTKFETLEKYKNTQTMRTYATMLGFENPFFKIHRGVAGAKSYIDGKEYINFSHYNYLGLSGHSAVNAAAMDAIEQYGTSAGASRLVAGERPIQQELEKALAKIYNADAAIVFVSGHAANVSTIRTLFGPKDLVVHDSLIHNSILEGVQLSGATRRAFMHNDLDSLEAVLIEQRSQFERVLIAVEGLYSMDGDCVDLPKLIDLKTRYQALLMVDEAHALGVLGENGFGTAEHWGVDCAAVDIWMGTLSKTLASCGGYIAGSEALIDILKYYAPGFVYSVGISPPLAAASLAALNIMLEEPLRVQELYKNTQSFLHEAKEIGLNTGCSQGFAIVPVIIGNSKQAVTCSNKLFTKGINVQPIIHPAVEEKAARLRFFVSALHTEEDIQTTLEHCRAICK